MRNRANLTTIVPALILFIAVHALIFASIPNDVTGDTKSVVVKKGTSLVSVSERLKDEELVSSQYLFLLSSLLLHGGKVVAGEYELAPAMSILEVTRKMAAGERKLYMLKIVEGYNVYTVAEAVERARIAPADAFLALARNHAFLERSGIQADSIEGYLTPDTYFFSRETDLDGFIETIVQRTFRLINKENVQKRMDEMHLNVHQLLSLASMIEKEAKLEEEKKVISAVFHNRLAAGMSLDSDPTVIYGLASFGRSLKKVDMTTPTRYNTYRLKGLPKGPICNPSKTSVLAALYPASVDFLYFVSRNDGSHIFSRTIQEHSHYVMVYQKNKTKNH